MKNQIRSRSGKNMPVNPEIIVVTDFLRNLRYVKHEA